MQQSFTADYFNVYLDDGWQIRTVKRVLALHCSHVEVLDSMGKEHRMVTGKWRLFVLAFIARLEAIRRQQR